MQAIILSAGEGKRLRPLTNNVPKVMLDINGKPVLEYHITLLKQHGINEIFLNLFTHPRKIIDYFEDGKKIGVNIAYSREDLESSYKGPLLLGSAGSLHNFKNQLKDDFFVIYGDVFMEVDFSKMYKFHKMKNSLFTIAVHKASHPLDSDLIEFDRNKRIINWLKAPHGRTSGVNNAGLYIINSKILELLPLEVPLDFAHGFIPLLLEKSLPLFAYETTEFMMDMGTLDRYNSLIEKLKNK